MIDAHCHLDDSRLQLTPHVFSEALSQLGMKGWICAGVSPSGWAQQVQLNHYSNFIWHTFGLHPWELMSTGNSSDLSTSLEQLQEALEGGLGFSPVGIGETGLHRNKGAEWVEKERQETSLLAHLELAEKFALPLVFHCVNAHGRLLDILTTEKISNGGMIHSFSGSTEVMKRYIDLGLHVSFSGLIARQSAKKARAAAMAVPSEWLLVETDAPDQRPQALADPKCTFEWLPMVIQELAVLRGDCAEKLAEITEENTRRLFRLDREMPSGG